MPRKYRRTFFDRHGPDAVNRARAIGYGGIAAGVSIPMFMLLGGSLLGLGFRSTIAFTVVGAILMGMLSATVGLYTGTMAGDAASRVYMGGGGSKYQEQYSQEQALVMQRRYDDALALFEHRIALEPTNVAARFRAADLYAKEGNNPQRAAELFREVQRIPDIASTDGVYASNRLADLYLGPLKQPGRAIVELRKLIDLYPNTPGAQQARTALAQLKAQLHATDDPARDTT